jgi:ParB-like chromosome segregation protein Spo0J
MEGEWFKELVEDIKQRGLQERITTWKDPVSHSLMIIDGRNRALACQEAGVEPEYTCFQGEGQDIVAFYISKNIHRRHLNAEQKRELLEKLIKADPDKSDRQHAKAASVDKNTAAKVRDQLERRGEIHHGSTRTDTRGRKQPSNKPKPKAATKTPPGLPKKVAAKRATTAAMAVEAPVEQRNDDVTGDQGKRKDSGTEPMEAPTRPRDVGPETETQSVEVNDDHDHEHDDEVSDITNNAWATPEPSAVNGCVCQVDGFITYEILPKLSGTKERIGFYSLLIDSWTRARAREQNDADRQTSAST